MVVGEGLHCRWRPLDQSCGVEASNDIGVALADDDFGRLARSVSSPSEGRRALAFVIIGGFVGVLVFGLLTVGEHAPAETNYCPIEATRHRGT